MRAVALLLLVAFAALSDAHGRNRSKRELLLRSKRRWVLSTIELTEEDPGPYPKTISQMFNDKTDKDRNDHEYVLSGTGVNVEPMGVFHINKDTGEVYVLRPVDREKTPFFHIKFDILNKNTGQPIDRQLSFDVEIKDINDNAPNFNKPRITENIKENTPEGTLPVRLEASDMDQMNTLNSNITFRVVSQKPSEPKITLTQIDSRMAHLQLIGCFDYDKVKTLDVIVEARDHGTPSLSSTAVVTINVVDTNTHPPVFKSNKYEGKVEEATKQRGILKLEVEDKDTPQTPGWRAKYTIVKGNEGGLFEIETDPNTNEGILNVIKESDFERTELLTLEISVENEEPLFVCKAASAGDVKVPPPASVKVTVEIVDINDPPYFDKPTNDVYQKEEEEPGKVLFTPNVKDDDSDINNIRYKLLYDPAKWMEIDKKTGQIKTVKKMDRESPFVKDGIYNITIGAIDDGNPPATGTCTVLIHLRDINDNTPKLVNNNVILCGNKEEMVMIAAQDSDVHPYSGPFTFSLRDTDGTLKQRWKIKPDVGQEGGLISLRTLPYGNYSVPLLIQDQQSIGGNNTVVVTICDCGKSTVCLSPEPFTASAGSSSIGAIFAALLLFLLLLLAVICKCGNNSLNHIPIVQDEGNQTLIKYNQEGGGAECMTKPSLLLTSTNGGTTRDGRKQVSQTDALIKDVNDKYKADLYTLQNQSSMGTLGMHQRDACQIYRGQNMNNSLRYQRSINLQSQQHIADHIGKRLQVINGNHENCPTYQPHQYAYEGQGSSCQTLDKISVSNLGDDFQFLNDLGPKFKTLGNICHEAVKEKNIKL
ncbi:cadherin-like protein 26 isoform X2 [Cynoglossus semilaevis]|uniref:Cadherin 26, tandem duplicate 1 n=1 Tax=Cynoglossus semilaevis TaxID=244447 RepID=A0A3P8X032_CYNSE|nr:cadherin-like protein 26 isoform X2 [Cynoglossus semilaevis]